MALHRNQWRKVFMPMLRGGLVIAGPVFGGRVRFAEVDGAVGEDGAHLYFADGGRLFLEGLGWRFGVFFEAGKSCGVFGGGVCCKKSSRLHEGSACELIGCLHRHLLNIHQG